MWIAGSHLKETTVAATVVADMFQYLEQRGVTSSEVARGIDAELKFPAAADYRIPGSTVERLFAFSQTRLDDSLVGLHMAEAYNPGTLDILGYVVLSCHTIGEVLSRFARYARLLNDGMRVEVVHESNSAYCRVEYDSSMDNYLVRDAQHAMDALWTGVARNLASLTAKPLVATEVWFRHAVPGGANRADIEREYVRILGAPVKFGAIEDRFILRASYLDEPILSANPALLQLFEQHADAALAKLDTHGTRAGQVIRLLAERMKGAVPTLGDVARELAMSERNLQRALRDDGTSFQKLVDELRCELAINHLANPSTSAGQVGFLLGFSEPSAFHRAFRRWTGKAPSEFRKVAAAS